eukprot:2371705-Prymnesium_polylepis.1
MVGISAAVCAAYALHEQNRARFAVRADRDGGQRSQRRRKAQTLGELERNVRKPRSFRSFRESIVRRVCVCYGSTGRSTQTGHASGTVAQQTRRGHARS